MFVSIRRDVVRVQLSAGLILGVTVIGAPLHAQEGVLQIVEAEDSANDPDILRDRIVGANIQIAPADGTTAIGRIDTEPDNDLFNGPYNQFGTFTGGLRAGIAFEEGVTFSSGTAGWATHDFSNLDPDEFGNFSEGGRAVGDFDIYTRGSDTDAAPLEDETTVDADLNDLIGVSGAFDSNGDFDLLNPGVSGDTRRDTTYDAAGLEFTFTAGATGRLAIDYVFASDEYNEWDGDGSGDEDSIFDDVMGVFIKESTVSTYTNIAVQPDEDDSIVSLVELNASNNPFLLQSNDRFSDGTGALADLPQTPGYEIGYDGFTTRMTAYMDVTQGTEYDLKLVVADAYLLGFESALFIPDGGIRIQTTTADPGINGSLTDQRRWTRFSVGDGLEADDIDVNGTSTANDSTITGDTLQNQTITVEGEYTQSSKRITTNHLTVSNTPPDPASYDLDGGVLFATFIEIGDHTHNTNGSDAGTFTYSGGKLIADRVVVDDGGTFEGRTAWSHDGALDVVNGGTLDYVNGTTRYSLAMEEGGRLNIFESIADMGDVLINSGAFAQVVVQDTLETAELNTTRLTIGGRLRQVGGEVNLVTRLPRGSAGLFVTSGTYTLEGEGVLEFQTTRPTLNNNYGRAMVVGYAQDGVFDLIDGTIQGAALANKPDGPRISIGDRAEGLIYVRTDGSIIDADGIHVGMLHRIQSQDSHGELHVMGGSIETAILDLSSELMIDDPEEPSIDRSKVSSLLKITDSGSVIEVEDRLRFGANTTVTAVAGSTITLTGSDAEVINEATNAAWMGGLNNLTLEFLGDNTSAGFSTLEVASVDDGDELPAFDQNFALAGLIVGQASPASDTLLKLVDNFDNSSGVEVLYVDDITIAAGSTLDIGDIDIYALSINDLTRITGTGTVTIVSPPGGGVPEPGAAALVLLGATALLRRRVG